MAPGDEWAEWHLTPRGWVRGTSRPDIAPMVERETPSDTVLTMRYYEYGWGLNASTELKERWRSPDAEAVERLLKQYGEAPRRL
jgi:hypothetical protein